MNPEVGLEGEFSEAYVGDLLSLVMANAGNGCAWITIQTHLNTIAVATLLEMACIIIPEEAEAEEDTIKKATEEGIPLFASSMNAFKTCLMLGESGIK